MFLRGRLNAILGSLLLMCVLSCAEKGHQMEDHTVQAAVSVLPQKYVLERLGGDLVDVLVVVPPGASPAAYEPSPSDMSAMSRAEVWFTTGVAFEGPWTPRFTGSNPDLMVVSTIEGIERLPIDRYSVRHLQETGDEPHDDHHHAGGSPDPHVWLSPELVRSQASVMAGTLALIDSSNADRYMENLREFQEEVDSLQAELHSMLDTLSFRSFMVFHPAWGYFADEFGLVQVPVESGGSEPSPGELAALVDYARENGIRTIFVSPQFSTSSAEAIASEIEGRVAVIDPLAGDWAENLREVARTLAEAAAR